MSETSYFDQWREQQTDLFEYDLEGVILELTEQVCRWMEEEDINRNQLAERLGVTRQFVTKLLNGNPNLTLRTLLKLSKALNKELHVHLIPLDRPVRTTGTWRPSQQVEEPADFTGSPDYSPAPGGRRQAVLQLDHFYLEALTFRSNPDYDRETAPGEMQIPMGMDFDIQRRPDSWEFRLILKVKVNDPRDGVGVGPYGIEFGIVGFFRLPPDTAEEEVRKYIPLNALVILWGVARGVVHQATAAGAQGSFLLPTVNFRELVRRKGEEMKRNDVVGAKKGNSSSTGTQVAETTTGYGKKKRK